MGLALSQVQRARVRRARRRGTIASNWAEARGAEAGRWTGRRFRKMLQH